MDNHTQPRWGVAMRGVRRAVSSAEPPQEQAEGGQGPQPRRRVGPTLLAGVCSIAVVLYLMWYSHVHRMPPKEYLRRLVQCFDQVCRAEGIDYWLDFGTLLGSARHRGLIPWDGAQDIDVGIHVNQTEKLRAAQGRLLRQCGFRLLHRNDWHNPGGTLWGIKRAAFRVFFDAVTPYYVDVADYEDLPGGRIADLHFTPIIVDLARSEVFPTIDCPFEGLTLRCPANTDGYLTMEYGDWRTPRKGFQAASPAHIAETGKRRTLVADHHRRMEARADRLPDGGARAPAAAAGG
eukprot:TRINITY_DN61548_c0_g1_i1.p1 TRINITY_DN61548_c0_g1~~TRINITY_DN61548_c0_g1_i1.p1  ORF type:complete len:291 (+),score=29.42 TRINITY_DN61548_c0_g1_i1:46-918(+)